MAKRHLLWIFCLAQILPGCSPIGEQSLDQPSMEERIDDLFTRYAESDEFSGAVLVAFDDQILFRKGYGFANREEQIPNTPDTQFHIQSVAKLFTYASVLMEVKSGRVSLDDPIKRYIPDFPNGDKITVDHLIHHRSGLFHYPHEVPGHVYGSLSTPIAIDSLIREIESYPLKFEPGTQYSYSNAGYSVLAKVVEEVSETSFDDYLLTNIFNPAEMIQTTADWDSASQDPAIGYEKVNGEFMRSTTDHPSHFIGAGTTYSTVHDLYHWYQAVYIDGSMEEFSPGGGDGRGMGYRAIFWPIPSFDLVIIILSNYQDAPLNELVGGVTAILLEKTAFLDLKQEDIDSLAGQYRANAGYGDFNFSIYGAAEKLFLSITDHLGKSLIYELRPISSNQFAFLKDGRLTGQMLTFKREDDAIPRDVLVDLNVLQLEAIRTK
jgi:CubicO group peptidase (beta-lactamase class C family)